MRFDYRVDAAGQWIAAELERLGFRVVYTKTIMLLAGEIAVAGQSARQWQSPEEFPD